MERNDRRKLSSEPVTSVGEAKRVLLILRLQINSLAETTIHQVLAKIADRESDLRLAA